MKLCDNVLIMTLKLIRIYPCLMLIYVLRTSLRHLIAVLKEILYPCALSGRGRSEVLSTMNLFGCVLCLCVKR
jgi:hypothetical protein